MLLSVKTPSDGILTYLSERYDQIKRLTYRCISNIATAASIWFHRSNLTAFFISRITKTNRCLSRATLFVASALMLNNASIASTVPLPGRNPYWFGANPFVVSCKMLFRMCLKDFFG